ncbi:MAG: TauD/TfdA dioxygenase family protein [Novosphingobium sp.]
MGKLTITRMAGGIGAELGGVSLAQGLDGSLVKEVRQALLDHLVIVFRDQDLTPEQFLAFAQCFGEPAQYPLLPGIAGFPMITEIVKREHERSNFGGIWHADTTYLECPPMGSMLHAQQVPPFGGDTLFANQYLAYESLSDGLRTMLDGMVAVSTSAKADVSKTREDMFRQAGDTQAHDYAAEQPVVRTHPETGRKALFVNVAHTSHFKGMTEEESSPLLNYLFAHQVKPEFTCRLSWRVGTLAFWDNRCAQHNPVNDYHGHRRVMRRITLAGERPY